MWWIALSLIIIFVFSVHFTRGMSDGDRLKIALDIVESSHFEVSEGFSEARKEDPDLVGWLKSGKDCVMHFSSQQAEETREIVDIASECFHPGLIVHYVNGHPVRIDKADIAAPSIREDAQKLLQCLHNAEVHTPESQMNFDGCHF